MKISVVKIHCILLWYRNIICKKVRMDDCPLSYAPVNLTQLFIASSIYIGWLKFFFRKVKLFITSLFKKHSVSENFLENSCQMSDCVNLNRAVSSSQFIPHKPMLYKTHVYISCQPIFFECRMSRISPKRSKNLKSSAIVLTDWGSPKRCSSKWLAEWCSSPHSSKWF